MHTIQDWLCLHKLEVENIQNMLGGSRAEEPLSFTSIDSFSTVESQKISGDILDRDTCFNQYVLASLVSFFGRTYSIQNQLSEIVFSNIPVGARPRTIHASGNSPIVELAWSHQPEDLVCLSHEVAHALQSNLSDGAFMPPVAREVCAFIGELILLNWVIDNNQALSDSLLPVWQSESEIYLGENAEDLLVALSDHATPYTYNMNYPLARIMAVRIFNTWDKHQIYNLFSSGSEAMSVLSIETLVEPLPNPLPPFANADQPSLNAYRSLGAMVLLDLECWDEQPDVVIDKYYGDLAKHLKEQTAFIGLQKDMRPMGYATLARASGNARVPRLQHLVAPFGDDQALESLVRERIKLQASISESSDDDAEVERAG